MPTKVPSASTPPRAPPQEQLFTAEPGSTQALGATPNLKITSQNSQESTEESHRKSTEERLR